jgi:hypothetical protein
VREPRVWHYQELLKRRDGGRLLGWLALAALLVLAMVIVRFIYLPHTVLVAISSGNTEGTVHQFLLSLAHDAHRGHRLDIEPAITKGTLDMLSLVDAGKLDFAIVQGGYDMDAYHNIRQAAVLSVGPVHLLVEQEYQGSHNHQNRNTR